MKKSLIILALFVLSGCQTQPEKGRFVPPADGRITREMAERYIKAAIYLEEAIAAQSEKVDKFKKKYERLISPDLSELADTTFLKKHPDIKREWEEIQKEIERAEKQAYKKAGTTEEEFEWIATALIDPKNKEMQRYVEKKLSEHKKKKGEGKKVEGEKP